MPRSPVWGTKAALLALMLVLGACQTPPSSPRGATRSSAPEPSSSGSAVCAFRADGGHAGLAFSPRTAALSTRWEIAGTSDTAFVEAMLSTQGQDACLDETTISTGRAARGTNL